MAYSDVLAYFIILQLIFNNQQLKTPPMNCLEQYNTALFKYVKQMSTHK